MGRVDTSNGMVASRKLDKPRLDVLMLLIVRCRRRVVVGASSTFSPVAPAGDRLQSFAAVTFLLPWTYHKRQNLSTGTADLKTQSLKLSGHTLLVSRPVLRDVVGFSARSGQARANSWMAILIDDELVQAKERE